MFSLAVGVGDSFASHEHANQYVAVSTRLIEFAWLDEQPAESIWATPIIVFEIDTGIELLEGGRRHFNPLGGLGASAAARRPSVPGLFRGVSVLSAERPG